MEKGVHMLLEDMLKKLNGIETAKMENIITLMAFCNLLGVSSVLANNHKISQQILKEKEISQNNEEENKEETEKDNTETMKTPINYFEKQKKKHKETDRHYKDYSSKPLTRLVWRIPPY
ncbi:MAG: hypothetical protein PWQ82_582 [Thermosediminibacterales bacterium]|nr:hypothetical protein [Thermosediminibacterales bacterium]MDK2835508.1 hypothetical protein [Thermosediminibacterales bacterium]